MAINNGIFLVRHALFKPSPSLCAEFTVPGRPQSDTAPVKCVEGEPAGWYNNGYPMLCGEGEVCDAETAAAGAGNPCKPKAA